MPAAGHGDQAVVACRRLAVLRRLALDRTEHAAGDDAADDEWFVREVEKGLAAADSGDFLEHEEVGKLIDGRFPG